MLEHINIFHIKGEIDSNQHFKNKFISNHVIRENKTGKTHNESYKTATCEALYERQSAKRE